MVNDTQGITPDVFADIYFFSTAEGGRKTPISTDILKCPMVLGDKYFESGLLLEGFGLIAPGQHVKNIPIKFLSPELLHKLIFTGAKFKLWDGRIVAEGKITKVCWSNPL